MGVSHRSAAIYLALVVGAAAAADSVAPEIGPPSARALAAPIDVPAHPATIGDVRYTFTVAAAEQIVAAGPGFVVDGDDGLTAYDGVTGAVRWSFPHTACVPNGVWSTTAVVLVECRRSGHVALDAMTGRQVWSDDRDLRLQGRVDLGHGPVPVVADDYFGALDPRTGALSWTRPLPGCADVSYAATDSHLVAVARCDTVQMWVFDGADGAPRGVDVDVADFGSAEFPLIEVAATFGDTVVVKLEARGDGQPDREALVAVDAETGDVDVIAMSDALTGVNRASRQYPGAVVEIADDNTAGAAFTDLLHVATGRTVRAQGIVMVNEAVPAARQWWAVLGEHLVTASAYSSEFDDRLVSVAPDGRVSHVPSPCGQAAGAVLVVPGALLVACPAARAGYDVFALR